MADVIIYYAFVSLFVVTSVGFATLRGVLGRWGHDLSPGWRGPFVAMFFPVLVILGHVAIILTFGIKVIALGNEGATGTQFLYRAQSLYPILSFSVSTLVAA